MSKIWVRNYKRLRIKKGKGNIKIKWINLYKKREFPYNSTNFGRKYGLYNPLFIYPDIVHPWFTFYKKLHLV